MPVGSYALEATLNGFSPARRTGVVVSVGHTETVPL